MAADSVASIIIPVGPYHRDIADRARAHAQAQTVPCEVLAIYDNDGRGAAWARNQGIAKATAPFITFLDADDTMQPTFVEKTFQRWLERGGAHYIYTDWRLPDGRIRFAEEDFDFFSTGMAHIITCLMPRAAAVAIGGFDERIRGAGEEDEDFYGRLHVAGMCHARVAEALVDYHIDQGRSATNATTNPDYAATAAAIEQRFIQKFGKYRGIKMAECCGNVTPPQGHAPVNEPFPDSILAYAMYSPQALTGPKSGLKYKRAGLGQAINVHKDDVSARPDMWQPVPSVANLVPPKEDVLRLAGLV